MSFPLIVVSLGGYDRMNPTGMLCYSDKSILADRMQLYLEWGASTFVAMLLLKDRN